MELGLPHSKPRNFHILKTKKKNLILCLRNLCKSVKWDTNVRRSSLILWLFHLSVQTNLIILWFYNKYCV
uniref:Uncharacterized protein n=1 Tax=Cairina moschata TaxID=8855 RepID=A0A8C3CZ79_CAIMO